MRLPIILAIILFIFGLLIDLYILTDIRAGKRKYSKTYIIGSTICLLIFILGICIPRQNPNSSILPIMWGLYAWLTVYIFKLIYLIFSLIGKIPILFHKKTIKLGLYIGLPLGSFIFITMWWGVIFTRFKIDVNHVKIESAKLPLDFDGYKIVQISDIHCGTWGSDTTFIHNLVDSINAQNPDVVFFTGDIVNRQTSEIYPFINVLSKIKAPVYSILGNHDYGDYINWNSQSEKKQNNIELADIQKRMNWNLMTNDYTFLHKGNDSIALIGVENWGEPPFKQYGDLKKSYPTINSNGLMDANYKILLTHNPEHWNREVINMSNIDLSLSGHTHALQMSVGSNDNRWSPAKWKYDKWGGLYSTENAKGDSMSLYVNTGAGEVGMPARIGTAYPEITVITLNHK